MSKLYDFPDLHELGVTGARATRAADFKDFGYYDVVIESSGFGNTPVGKIFRDAGSMTSMVTWNDDKQRFLGFTQAEAVEKLVRRYLDEPSKANPPAEEIVGFHCTSEQNAESILKNGFEFMPYDTDTFVQMFSECMDMLGISGDEREKLEELYAKKPNKAAELVQEAWYKVFGGGCVIWISYGEPAREFGEACLSVRLPKTARLLTKDWTYGEAFWVPTKKIAASRFKRVENNPRTVPLSKVLAHLKKTDGTGDPDFLKSLANEVSGYKDWVLVALDPKRIENYVAGDDKTIEYYAELGVESMPPIVVVPSDSGKYDYEIVDGGHRAAAAELLGEMVRAYVPAGRNAKNA